MDFFENVTETVTDVAANAAEAIQDFFDGKTITTRREIITTCTICTLLGLIAGFALSPIKKGIYFNISNNGNGTEPEKEQKNRQEKQCCCQGRKKRK